MPLLVSGCLTREGPSTTVCVRRQQSERFFSLPHVKQRRKDKLPVSKMLLGFFIFVLFGSGAPPMSACTSAPAQVRPNLSLHPCLPRRSQRCCR